MFQHKIVRELLSENSLNRLEVRVHSRAAEAEAMGTCIGKVDETKISGQTVTWQ